MKINPQLVEWLKSHHTTGLVLASDGFDNFYAAMLTECRMQNLIEIDSIRRNAVFYRLTPQGEFALGIPAPDTAPTEGEATGYTADLWYVKRHENGMNRMVFNADRLNPDAQETAEQISALLNTVTAALRRQLTAAQGRITALEAELLDAKATIQIAKDQFDYGNPNAAHKILQEASEFDTED